MITIFDRKMFIKPHPRPLPLWLAYGVLNRHCWENPQPTLLTGAAKVYTQAIIPIRPWKLFGFWKFSGYGRNKLPSLLRTYMTNERLDLIRAKIEHREPKAGRISGYTSIGAAMGTGKKDSPRKTGECIQGISFELIPKRDTESGEAEVNVNVFFRVTEVTRRFLGDLVFIDHAIRRVLEPVGLLPNLGTVTLHFATFYSILYHFVIWCRMFPDARALIRKDDAVKKDRWDAHIYEGTTGRSCAKHNNPLTHSPKICAARIYKQLKGTVPLFSHDGAWGVKLEKRYEAYDGPPTG